MIGKMFSYTFVLFFINKLSADPQQGLMCLAQGHNAVPQVRLKPTTRVHLIICNRFNKQTTFSG